MKIFDCTLRDGGNVVGNGFSPELTLSMIQGLIRCGIKDIEFGNAKGMGSHERGAAAPLSDLEYMQLAAPYADKASLGMFLLASQNDPEKIRQSVDNGMSFIRVGAAAGDGKKALEAVAAVKAAGLICRYSLMKAYLLTAEELAAESRMLQDAGVDIITIMDSAGTMLPDEVTLYTKTMKSALNIPVGFHGHNNMGLSQANALAAAYAGADEVDGGLLGMARSAGNCSTELTAATFVKLGIIKDLDIHALLSYLDRELIPAMEAYHYRPAVSPLDLVLGLSGCHSSFLGKFKEVAKEEGVDLYQLIIAASAKDRKAPSLELMHETAKSLK